MTRIGLTGSIGMGKSTIAAMFAARGVPVWDADHAVHDIYANSSSVRSLLVEAFGDVVTEGVVDRNKLSELLKADPKGFERLNAIVHPAVVEDRKAFMEHHNSARLLVFDIPLLFETGAESWIDKVLVVSAPSDVQRARVLSRPNMTAEKFDSILARQVPDDQKRKKADFVIDTSQDLETCRRQVDDLIMKFS